MVTVKQPTASFLPAANWQTTKTNATVGQYLNAYHSTNITGSYVDVHFNGSGAGLYGSVGPAGGQVTCSIDGVPSKVVSLINGTDAQYAFICSASYLENGNYTLHVELTGAGNFGVNYFTLDTTKHANSSAAAILQGFPSPETATSSATVASETATSAPASSSSAVNTATGTATPAATTAPTSGAPSAKKLGASGVVALLSVGLLLLVQ